MAERRMFAKTIIDSDAFLDMPPTTQLLYFHLAMRADDDGFVNKPKSIMRMVGATQGDAEMLIAKKFLIPFESGVVVIKHWKIHNYIRKDMYRETKYKEEKSLLMLDENNSYTMDTQHALQPCNEPVTNPSTQDRLGKVRLGEDSLSITVSKDTVRSTDILRIMEAWNELGKYGIPQVTKVANDTNRYKQLTARIKSYGVDSVLEAIGKIANSSYLQGGGKNGWTITFDWFIRPNNFPKVLEGNYDNSATNSKHKNVNEIEPHETVWPGTEAVLARFRGN